MLERVAPAIQWDYLFRNAAWIGQEDSSTISSELEFLQAPEKWPLEIEVADLGHIYTKRLSWSSIEFRGQPQATFVKD